MHKTPQRPFDLSGQNQAQIRRQARLYTGIVVTLIALRVAHHQYTTTSDTEIK